MKNPHKGKSKVNPQPDKVRRISTEFWQALTFVDLNGAEYGVVLEVINQTWGYNKKYADISYKTLRQRTGRSRLTVIKTVRKLVQRNILVVEHKLVKDSLPVNVYQINKYYDTWLCSKLVKRAILVQESIPVQRNNETSIGFYTKLVQESVPIREEKEKKEKKGDSPSSPSQKQPQKLNGTAKKLFRDKINKHDLDDKKNRAF